MFIETNTTPNPNTLKFVPVYPEDSKNISEIIIDFVQGSEKVKSPLARALFKIEGVKRLHINYTFLSVNKADDIEWDSIKTQILMEISDFLISGRKLVDEDLSSESDNSTETSEEDSEVIEDIKSVIDSMVRPAVAQDGGDIEFSSFNSEDGVVHLKLKGACSGCPSATHTLKDNVEHMLAYYIPEVRSVEAVADEEA